MDIDAIGSSSTPIPGDPRPGQPVAAVNHDIPEDTPSEDRATTSQTSPVKPTLLPNTDRATADPAPPGDSVVVTATPGSTPTGSPSGTASSSGAPAGDRDANSKAKRERRERNAAEEKRKNEEVRLALWPTPESVKTILSQSGEGSIDYGRLFGSYRFRDVWLTFQKKTRPTSTDVTNLRKLAVEILGKRKGRPHRHKGEKSKDQTPVKGTVTVSSDKDTEKYDKRRRDSSSSSSTGSGLKQPFKIPRTGSSTPSAAASAPATASTSSWAEEMEDTDTGVIESEAQYGPLEGFTHDLSTGLPNTNYAEATSGKRQKTDYPYLLYVHKGRDLRERIPKKVWAILKEKLNEILVEDVLADKPSPDIDWTGYKAGTGVIATTNPESRDIMTKIIDNIEVAELKFKAYPKGAKDEQMTVTIKVPPEYKSIDEQKLCHALGKRNKLVGRFEYYSCRAINKESGERLLRVIVDQKTVDQIRKMEGRITMGLRYLEVYLANQRLG